MAPAPLSFVHPSGEQVALDPCSVLQVPKRTVQHGAAVLPDRTSTSHQLSSAKTNRTTATQTSMEGTTPLGYPPKLGPRGLSPSKCPVRVAQASSSETITDGRNRWACSVVHRLSIRTKYPTSVSILLSSAAPGPRVRWGKNGRRWGVPMCWIPGLIEAQNGKRPQPEGSSDLGSEICSATSSSRHPGRQTCKGLASLPAGFKLLNIFLRLSFSLQVWAK